MRVLLANFFNKESIVLRLLQAKLSSKHDCKMLFICQNDLGSVIKALEDFKPDVLAFSLVSANLGLYKKYYPTLRLYAKKIIVGGWCPTLSPESCIGYADTICRGECDGIIEEIVERKVGIVTAPLGSVNWMKPNFGDELCYLIENGFHKKDPMILNYRYGTFIGKGCPHSCSYCSNSKMKELYPNWTKIRYRSYDEVLEELIHAKKNMPAISTICFYDEVFLPPKSGFDHFLERYKKEINLPFYCLFYPKSYNEKRIQSLKKAGLAGIWLGVQSGSKRVREEVYGRKTGSNEEILEQANLFSRNGISVRYDFIFDSPFEPVAGKDYNLTLDLIKKLPEPCSFNFFKCRFFPNTKLTELALEKGMNIKIESDFEGDVPVEMISEKRKKNILKIRG